MFVEGRLIAATIAVIVGVRYTLCHLKLEAQSREKARQEHARNFGSSDSHVT